MRKGRPSGVALGVPGVGVGSKGVALGVWLAAGVALGVPGVPGVLEPGGRVAEGLGVALGLRVGVAVTTAFRSRITSRPIWATLQ